MFGSLHIQLLSNIVMEMSVTFVLYLYHCLTEDLRKFATTMVCVTVKGKPVIGVIHRAFDGTTCKFMLSQMCNCMLGRRLGLLPLLTLGAKKGQFSSLGTFMS